VTETAQAADLDAVITAEVRSWIGRSTELMELPEEIAASDVRRYVEATGDRNPLWLDDAAARSAGYRGRLVPPMLVVEVVWRLKSRAAGRLIDRIPLPANYLDTRNFDTEIEWIGPVHVGERLAIRHRIRDIVGRASRRGLGVYITRETEYARADGSLIARVLQTIARFPKTPVEGT
jgi:acyl dehydratase